MPRPSTFSKEEMRQPHPIAETESRWQRFYHIIEQIPEGRVATYGQIAELAGLKGHARQVGYALAALSDQQADSVPWHRVINAKGEVSPRRSSSGHRIQRKLLEAEGIEFRRERVDLKDCRWSADDDAVSAH